VSHVDRRAFFQAVAATGLVTAEGVDAPAQAGPAARIPGTTVPAPKESAPELRRGPYLQAQGPDRIVVRWRTDGTARNVKLRFGDRQESLDRVVPAGLVTTPFSGVEDWAAVVEGLEPSKTYYYEVEASTAILAGAAEAHTFRTTPPRGKPSPCRFLMLGDCGTNRVDSGNPGKSIAARNGFRRFNHGRRLDGIILLGDNAYSHGTDAQYQTALFSVYHDELAHLPLWPCIGNHELTDDYFGIFTVPEKGEAGGVPSNSPSYYSFDYANSHFVVLDLWKTPWRDPADAQLRWLEADLAATNQDWIIAVNHFPPYCAGKYESEKNGFLIDVRQRILPVLEEHGVDMLVTGHDHTYQRSYLLDGHYGTRDTFDPAKHLKAEGDGTREPMVKGRGPHSGIVAVVTGTAGAEQGFDPIDPRRGPQLDHPVMVKLKEGHQGGRGVRKLGSFLLEIDGLTITGTQIDDHAEIVDQFTLQKTP
jgi:hypothetical protein